MIVNDTYIPLIHNHSRYLILFGGSGSGKSVFAAQKVIMRIKTEPRHKILCLRKIAATVKDSIFAELLQVINDNDFESQFIVNKTDRTITHISGNQILCKGLDEPEKIKSIQGISSMWLEEATEFTETDFDQLDLRIRGEKDNYIQLMLSFNPIDEMHWIKRRFVDTKNIRTLVCHTTYMHNEFLSDEDKETIESLKEKNKLYYDVYCLGLWGIVDTSNKFMFAFSREKHVKHYELDEDLSIRLSFDFNIDPFVVAIYQRPSEKEIRIVDSIWLPNSDIEQVCDHIISRFGERAFVVTGDVTGGNRTGVVRGKLSYWQVILSRLDIPLTDISRKKLRSKNIDLIESRILCNSVFQHIDITINPGLKDIINDCTYAKVDYKGILLKDRVDNKNDFLDTVRYICDAEFHDMIKKPKKYR